MANTHKRANLISKLKVNGIWLSKDIDLKRGISNYFQSMLENTHLRRPKLEGDLFKLSQSSKCLENPFGEEEVVASLSELGGD